MGPRCVANTTWAQPDDHKVHDIELLREKLKVDKWLVFGGSWGSTLTLAYAQSHPDRCTALIMRGIFLLRRSELQFFYQEGTSRGYSNRMCSSLTLLQTSSRKPGETTLSMSSIANRQGRLPLCDP